MTAVDLITAICARGVELVAAGDRLRWRPREALSPEEINQLRALKPDLLPLVTYRQVLRRWFELTAQGPTADPTEVARTYQDLLRLIDEVGEPRATQLRRQWAREWWRETGVCPFCGEPGPYHDPDRGGEPA